MEKKYTKWKATWLQKTIRDGGKIALAWLLACSLGERNKFTIEKLNSSRSALAEKGASDSEAHEFIAHSVCGA